MSGGHILLLGLVQRSSPCFVNLSCAEVGLVPVSLPLFYLFFRPCLIHARMSDWNRAFVHGHTFLHSWSGPMTLVVGLQYVPVQSSSCSLHVF